MGRSVVISGRAPLPRMYRGGHIDTRLSVWVLLTVTSASRDKILEKLVSDKDLRQGGKSRTAAK